MPQHEKIDYLEFPSPDLPAVKTFFSKAFGWTFTDYGPEYTSFSGEGVDGGFFAAANAATTAAGSVLVVLFSANLEATLAKVVDAGATVVRETFAFPGGRRFHFAAPDGNEFAVWSDRDAQ